MNKQSQGIALILFGILLLILSIIDPDIIIIGGFSETIFMIAGIVSGIIGVILNFKSK